MRFCLTGGIACGKSLLARFLRELGVEFIDADDVVHELEASGGAAVAAVRERFGDAVIATDGGVDRKRLAMVVFNDSSAREDLEKILFPLVRMHILEFVDAAPTDSSLPRLAIIPLIFESHWEQDYDIILCIASSREVQIERMMRLRGYSRAEAEARLAAQMPVSEKASRADYVVENNTTSDCLRNEAERLVMWLREKNENIDGRIKEG